MDLRFVKNSEEFVEGRLYSRKYRVSKNLLFQVVFDLRYKKVGVSIRLYEIANLKDNKLWLISSKSIILDEDKNNIQEKMDKFLSSSTFLSIAEEMLNYAYSSFKGFAKWKYNRKKNVWEKVYSVDKRVKKVIEVPKT